jgi:beta-lactamase superfamily II metal-dependent hydrolase
VNGIHCSLNDFSMVLVLEAGEDPQSFRGLLTGDAGGLTINEALTRFVAVQKPALDAVVFDMVKIPHHGSWRSHIGSKVPTMIRVPNESVAVVSSCSQSSRLPRRKVLQAYLEKEWRVYDTGKRRNLTDRFFNLLAWTEGVEGKYDVCVSWEAAGGLKVGPNEARVETEDLALYPSGAMEG